jgi:hypothetical protein
MVVVSRPMANPNPNPATRFSSENQPEKSGRPQGSRDKLSKDFLAALSDDFATNGKTVIQTARLARQRALAKLH